MSCSIRFWEDCDATHLTQESFNLRKLSSPTQIFSFLRQKKWTSFIECHGTHCIFENLSVLEIRISVFEKAENDYEDYHGNISLKELNNNSLLNVFGQLYGQKTDNLEWMGKRSLRTYTMSRQRLNIEQRKFIECPWCLLVLRIKKKKLWNIPIFKNST